MNDTDPFAGRQLDALTQDEARAVLERFLELGRSSFSHVEALTSAEGFTLDFTLASAARLIRAAAKQIKFGFKPLSDDTPQWIRDSPIHREGEVVFDEASCVWILRVGYYLGESFVRTFPVLKWNVGHPDFAFCNMPVVAGFLHKKELPPLVVTENIYVRVLARGKGEDHFGSSIEHWRKSVPGQT